MIAFDRIQLHLLGEILAFGLQELSVKNVEMES